MSWYRLVVGKEQMGQGALEQIRDRFLHSCASLKGSSATLYIERKKATEPTIPTLIYFPPAVVELCKNILTGYAGEACEDDPDISILDEWIKLV